MKRPGGSSGMQRPGGSSGTKRPGGSPGTRRGGDRELVMPLQAALAEVLKLQAPADSALRAFFRANPLLGRRDRGAIAETVFDVLRNRRLYAHLAQGGSGPLERRLGLLSLGARGADLAPLRPSDEERAWLARALSIDRSTLSPELRGSLPDWMLKALSARFAPAELEALAAALLEPAPLQLRANALAGSRDDAIALLAADGIEARALEVAPLAIEVRGKPALERSKAFESGAVEVQDAGSQLLALLVAPRRGQTVVDFCAGAGGKTLALAAAMRGSGQVFACDVSAARLQRLKPRLARSGASNVQPFGIADERDPKLARLEGRADAVLVDAPCSGSGTLRRNPDLKWRTAPADVGRLVGEQRRILEAAARLVKPGGVLVYGTCSLLDDENEANVHWFESAHPDWRRDDAATVLAAQGASLPDDAVADGLLRLLPHRHGTDGFFAARWIRPK